jgi:2-oxoglutarate dehydrogenase E2 component (dihydrolipoamide succinyltransferase)
MAMYPIIVPTPGESITEVEIARWLVEEGQYVSLNQTIAEIESDKATLELVADVAGVVHLHAKEGDTVPVGSKVAEIDESATAPEGSESSKVENNIPIEETPIVEQKTTEKPIKKEEDHHSEIKTTPTAKAMMKEYDLNVDDIISGLRRIKKGDIEQVLSAKDNPVSKEEWTEEIEIIPMSPLRKKLSQRLVSVKNETAMLTTFNEINLYKLMEIRKRYQPDFQKKHGFKLGFMSLFTKAVSEALKLHPMVGASIKDEEIHVPHYHHISIAVQTPKGLMVPVVKDVEKKTIAQIEGEIKELAAKARSKKISLQEMEGGIFTITNGGTFGSMMSTPIINPPQSAILGMHNIIERPIAENGQVVIRPMMYVALSYDHRIIDGKDSVGFLVKIKQLLEEPSLLLTGPDPYLSLFDL